MITSRNILREYIDADRSRYVLRKPFILGWILNDESYYVMKYLKNLRCLEYYRNCFPKSLLRFYYEWNYRRLSMKYNLSIRPNTVGKGLRIPHLKGGIILDCVSMGEYCTVNAGVILGKKNGFNPIIGNNVDISVGAKVVGNVVVGDNVIIAPNSVVVKDVPSNAIVSGIPAKIIKYL